MFEWLNMDDAAREIAAATKEDIGLLGLLREAYAGRLKVCALIPTWRTPGSGELVFYTDDGGRIGCATDGLFRHLSSHDFQSLHTHNRLVLAGRRVELPNSDTGGHIEAFIGPDAPTIGIGDLRVSAAEIERFIGSRLQAEAGGKALLSDQGDDRHEQRAATWQDQSRKQQTQADDTQTRQDAMSLELEEIKEEMTRRGERVTTVSVMAVLKNSAGKGGCVIDIAGDGNGVVWERSNGNSETLSFRALEARLRRTRQATR